MKVLAIGASAATVALVATAGPFVAHKISVHRAEANYDPPGIFAVAEPHPEFGDGDATPLFGARVTRDGTLQVLAEGGPCVALSHSRWSPSRANSVAVIVYVTHLGRDCGATTTNWFVNLTGAPTDVSTLVDTAHGGAPIKVVDCRHVPEGARNICSARPGD
jgi:hypothetical protein